jgi:hypothetical protein
VSARSRIVVLALASAGASAGAIGSARGAEPARPNEDEMFGGAPSAPADAGTAAPGAADARVGSAPAASSPPTAGATSGASPGFPTPTAPPSASDEHGTSRDVDLLGDPNAGPRLSQEVAPDDPLKIGGQIYLRASYNNPGSPTFDFSNPTDVKSQHTTFSAPSLVDAFFDARPNDRVRGFLLGRLFFDPTLPTTTASTGTTSGTMTGTSMAVTPTAPGLSGVSSTRGPAAVLDQLWLRFDIAHTVFVTAGRQHVKWGTARFWTPTDFLHPEHRNPVAVFDARPGYTMLKLHVPWEERGWNFYAFGLVEGVRRWDPSTNTYPLGNDRVATLGQLGGAARAELVLGPAELGLDAVVYKDQKPRYGADLSFGVGDFDLYVDAGFRYGSEIPRAQEDFSITYAVGIKPQITTGGTYSLKYNDNDVFTLAAEYFYNALGYPSPRVYPALFYTGTFEFFYTGRHYAAVSAIANAPWSWNYSNFSFTTIGNLSDQSFISRIDYSYTLLTHMTFEAFGAVNYGRREGEFRLGVDSLTLPNGQTFSLSPQAFSLGIGLRVKI